VIDRDDLSALSGYLDGELTAEERAEVEEQLAASPEWRAELDVVRAARDAVRGLAPREPRAGFWEAVSAVVRDEPATGTSTPVHEDPDAAVALPTWRRSTVVRWAAGGVAAAALVAVFLIPGREQVRPSVTAVATQHGASSAEVGDRISGLVPLGPLRGPR
jgi:negative regulator of sigma E activity